MQAFVGGQDVNGLIKFGQVIIETLEAIDHVNTGPMNMWLEMNGDQVTIHLEAWLNGKLVKRRRGHQWDEVKTAPTNILLESVEFGAKNLWALIEESHKED